MKIPVTIPSEGAKEGDLVYINRGMIALSASPLYERLVLRKGELTEVIVNGTTFRSPLVPQSMESSFLLNPTIFEDLDDELTLAVKVRRKIPMAIIEDTRKILQVIHEVHKTEGCVLVGYNSKEDTFITYIPKQEVTSVKVDLEPEDINEIFKIPGVDTIAASFHSHPFGKGHSFLSGTDHANEGNIKGVPIASFNFSSNEHGGRNVFSFGKMEISFHGVPLLQEELVEEVPGLVVVPENERVAIKAAIKDKVKKPYSFGSANGRVSFPGYNNHPNANYRQGNHIFDFEDEYPYGDSGMGELARDRESLEQHNTEWCSDPGAWLAPLMEWETDIYESEDYEPSITLNKLGELSAGVKTSTARELTKLIYKLVTFTYGPTAVVPMGLAQRIESLPVFWVAWLLKHCVVILEGAISSLETNDCDDTPALLVACFRAVEKDFLAWNIKRYNPSYPDKPLLPEVFTFEDENHAYILLPVAITEFILYITHRICNHVGSGEAKEPPAITGKYTATDSKSGVKAIQPHQVQVRPAEVKPASPAIPAVKPELPAATPEIPAAKPEIPVAKPEIPAEKVGPSEDN